VQQSSDTTFRLYDWGRTDANGRPRALHVKESLISLDLDSNDRHKIPPLIVTSTGDYTRSFRAACRYFALEEHAVSRAGEFGLPVRDGFQVTTVLSGRGELKSAGGTMSLDNGQTVLLPASAGPVRVSAAPNTRFLLSYVPDLMADVIQPLRQSGISDAKIDLLGGNPRHNDLRPLL
jgi:mannose-6-phosphate isomerase